MRSLSAFIEACSAVEQRQRLAKNVLDFRAGLRERLCGKYAIIGWTATGETDFYPTSIHSLCPGVVMQGVVFNAIVTRHLWTTAPWWTGALATLFLGR